MIALSPPLAGAQTPARSLDQLQSRVHPGETVTLTDIDGREVTGAIVNVSSSALVLLVASVQRDFQEAGILAVRERRDDSLTNGAIWGGGIGVAALLSIARAGVGADGPWSGKNTAHMTYVAAGVGCGIGVAIDAMIKGHLTLYARPSPASGVTVIPVFSGARRGALVAIRF
ncbi:MAG: hypothetical protein ABI652_09150 [Acidobacteriota bacterium]